MRSTARRNCSNGTDQRGATCSTVNCASYQLVNATAWANDRSDDSLKSIGQRIRVNAIMALFTVRRGWEPDSDSGRLQRRRSTGDDACSLVSLAQTTSSCARALLPFQRSRNGSPLARTVRLCRSSTGGDGDVLDRHHRPPVVEKDFQRTPHRDPANDQETFANDSAQAAVAEVAGDGVANCDGCGEKCQRDDETDATTTKQLPKCPLGRHDPLTEYS